MPDHPHDGCDKRCFMCERPWDTFKHIHMAPNMLTPPKGGEVYTGPEVVLCIPCLANVSQALHTMLSAYSGGAYIFDTYSILRMQSMGRRQEPGPGNPLPKWMEPLIQEMRESQGESGDGY